MKFHRSLFPYLAAVILLLLIAIFSPWLTPQDPYAQDLAQALMPPSADHLLGTDRYGRDILSRITVTCIYYGDYSENGKTYCYVLRGDRFGYVERPMGFTYPENPEYSQKTASEEPPSPSPEDASGLSPAQIVFLVLLCLLIPTLAALILRPTRKKTFPDDDSLN